MEDEVEGFGWMAVVKLKEVSQGFTLLERNEGK